MNSIADPNVDLRIVRILERLPSEDKKSFTKSLEDLRHFPQKRSFVIEQWEEHIKTLKDEASDQDFGTCYAHAIANAIVGTQRRIAGRNPPQADVLAGFIIAERLENGLPALDGGNTYQVLEEECRKRQLRCAGVDEDGCIKALKEGRSPVVATFRLSPDQWKAFSTFFGTSPPGNPLGILRTRDLPANPNNLDGGGHAITIESYSSNDEYFVIKNSWGRTWADSGFCKIGKGALDFKFFEVFFLEEDLLPRDLENYKEQKAEQEKRLKVAPYSDPKKYFRNATSQEWSSSGPTYRVAEPGLCLEGECEKVGCEAYQKDVIINKKMGVFHSSDLTNLKCPKCDSTIGAKINQFAFNKCQYSVKNVDTGEIYEHSTVGNHYYKFAKMEYILKYLHNVKITTEPF